MIAVTLSAGCVNMGSDSVTDERSAPHRKACANALAAGVITEAQAACLSMLDVLKAGFGE